MLALIVIVLFILLVILGVYFLIFSSEKKPVTDLLGESVQAWREDDLKLDSFRVDMREAELGDVFSSFPQAERDYITSDEVDVNIERMRKLEQGATAAVREYSRNFQSAYRDRHQEEVAAR